MKEQGRPNRQTMNCEERNVSCVGVTRRLLVDGVGAGHYLLCAIFQASRHLEKEMPRQQQAFGDRGRNQGPEGGAPPGGYFG